MPRVLCGVPKEECEGASVGVNKGMHFSKTHTSHEEAFSCHRRWLLRQGYKQTGSRAFAPPEGAKFTEITILTRKSRFGSEVRKGKTGEKTESGKRCTFKGKNPGGTIISN